MIEQPALLLWGDFSGERLNWGDVCAEFGWTVLREGDRAPVAAVLLDSTGWREHLRFVRRALPDAVVMLAHNIGPDLHGLDPAREGVFDIVLRPFHYSECRQTIGHVAAHLDRRGCARAAPPKPALVVAAKGGRVLSVA